MRPAPRAGEATRVGLLEQGAVLAVTEVLAATRVARTQTIPGVRFFPNLAGIVILYDANRGGTPAWARWTSSATRLRPPRARARRSSATPRTTSSGRPRARLTRPRATSSRPAKR